ncbi:MAG: NUDIX hydrolase [Sulfitobacter sp.]|nr:NUDIX hydrolase [Sulfitobacter sp.]
MNMGQMAPFGGAKCALFIGKRLAVILRDDTPGLPWAGHWDFPGGGREGQEAPLTCARRECREELGIDFEGDALLWAQPFVTEGERNWFFVAQLEEGRARDIRLGDEGREWRLMTPAAYLSHPLGIDRLQGRLRIYLAGERGSKDPPAR